MEASVIYYLSSGWRKRQKPASAVKKFPFIAQREASSRDLNKPYKPYLDSWISEFYASSMRNTRLNNHLASDSTGAKSSMETRLILQRFEDRWFYSNLVFQKEIFYRCSEDLKDFSYNKKIASIKIQIYRISFIIVKQTLCLN